MNATSFDSGQEISGNWGLSTHDHLFDGHNTFNFMGTEQRNIPYPRINHHALVWLRLGWCCRCCAEKEKETCLTHFSRRCLEMAPDIDFFGGS